MKVYLNPPAGTSLALQRVALALARYAPRGVEVVADPKRADFRIWHALGAGERTPLLATAQDHAVIQYCLRTTEHPDTRDWLPVWSRAKAVWSYYDLRAAIRADGAQHLEATFKTFYHAPLGVDGETFRSRGQLRDYIIGTSGYIAETEGALEASRAMAAACPGLRMFHLGPDLGLGGHVDHATGLSEAALADRWSRCVYVAGLRVVEGFEFPALEGLACGARPILYDKPHYRHWYGDHAVYVQEPAPFDSMAVQAALEQLLPFAPKAVSREERQAVLERFDWARIVRGFWDACGIVDAPRRATRASTKKVLWIGDAVMDTGFARVTHNVCDRLQRDHDWDVTVLGVNYKGDPDGRQYPYPIWPAFLGGDVFGIGRFGDVVKAAEPDVVVVNADPWIAQQFVRVHTKALAKALGVGPRLAAYMPVDAPNQGSASALNGLDLAIWYTQFGQDAAAAGGYRGANAIIPHGIELDVYRPLDQREARARLGLTGRLPDDAFIISAVNRNALRKRMYLVLLGFAAWLKSVGDVPAYLHLHCAPDDPTGWNLPQLIRHLGLEHRVIWTSLQLMERGKGIAQRDMPIVYSAGDVGLSATMGEGWGLTTLEGMACGLAQIVPEYSALAEWARGGVTYLPVRQQMVTPGGANTLGGVVDVEDIGVALTMHFLDADYRAEMATRGRALAHDPKFSWDAVAASFDHALTTVCEGTYEEHSSEQDDQHAESEDTAAVEGEGRHEVATAHAPGGLA